ncbi:hypothetical protein [Legionella resiliens]|uniref:Uncharacterized protein n=1 Tax=Legionella resiliens TaxID=2905958 RepID=A0ABS8X017_9GAMM|nr:MULTISPECIES: hypothetical protein [unclassified Legionella]MCE0722937.1 hypothetical protein [Legionella sp. 9fVS26]MCE3532090.1 hypothetical protein [Legionella sp. 8cVS16]
MISKSEILKKHNAVGITTDHFVKEYKELIEKISGLQMDTPRLNRMSQEIIKIKENDSLSSDAKIMALLDVFVSEYAVILNSFGGSYSELGTLIKNFCSKNFGVELGKAPLYRIKPDGLMMHIFNDQIRAESQEIEEESLLPPIRRRTTELGSVSKSEPILSVQMESRPRVSSSLSILDTETEEIGQFTVRKTKELTRLGSMFGAKQFCYAKKPSGVEPGFRAIDLDKLFFQELDSILAAEHLPSSERVPDKERLKLIQLRDDLKNVKSVEQKRIVFSVFINSHIKGPHPESTVVPGIQWLCNEIKEAVAKNNGLSAWMYKLDYAEGQKDRIKANKEAIREFVGTRLAGIFSAQNQKQELIWVKNGSKGVHALLACGWKNGLRELTSFLYGGSEPDYNGVLVEDKQASIKRSKYIAGLAKNLIFGIAIGDRDGMGKDAQNKGFADDAFYGFDYGKPYEGEGVCSSLSDDFSFEDSFAKAPSLFRSSSTIGFARHFMYRNYSVFYDTTLSERMVGFHLLRKMITGENPSDEVIESYPELRQELERIEKSTPSYEELLGSLGGLRRNCREGSQLQALIDTDIMKIWTGKLSNFDLYFTKIKIDLIEMGIKNDMPYEELEGYLGFINDMAATAHNSNQQILAKFQKRMVLMSPEIDLIDKLEKYFSPTSVMSHDGAVFLRTMRLDPQSGRIPFQLKKEENGTYTLTTTNKKIAHQLKEEFALECVHSDEGLSCSIMPKQLLKLMETVEFKYNQKREMLLIKPTYKFVTFPNMSFLLNQHNTPSDPKIDVGFLWHAENTLSLRIIAKTEKQAQQVQKVFGILPVLNQAELIEISSGEHYKFQQFIDQSYEDAQELIRCKACVKAERREDVISTLSRSSMRIASTTTSNTKWNGLHEKAEVEEEVPISQLLLKRLRGLIADSGILQPIEKVVNEITSPVILEELMQYNDKTLSSRDNLKAIIDERFDAIVEIGEEYELMDLSASHKIKQTIF